MKKSFKIITSLLVSFLLPSCAGGIDDSSSSKETTSSSNEDIVSSSNKEEHVSSSSEGEEEMNPTEWSSSDLESMSRYLNGYTSLPFPIGFTPNYIEASGTDQDGTCFIVYDDNSGNLCESYGNTLIEAGFTYSQENSEPDDSLYDYYLSIEDSIDLIFVQIDYYQNAFEIFAWIETSSGESKSDSFPYSQLAQYFGKESLGEEEVPSFELKENERYDYYFSKEGIEYFYIGGNFSNTTTDEEYVEKYVTVLESKNYDVDKENQIATNENVGLKIEYGAFEGYFLLQISKYQKIEAGDHSITFNNGDFPSTYNDTSISKDNISFSVGNVMNASDKSSSYIQFRNASKGSGYLQNTSSISQIVSLVVTAVSTDYYGILTLYVSENEINDENTGTQINPNQEGNTFTYVIDIENAHYFKLINEKANASKNVSIVLNYNLA